MEKFSLFLESDQAALVRSIESIRSRQGKITPILVYADWLQENGMELEAHLSRMVCNRDYAGMEKGSDGSSIKFYIYKALDGNILYTPQTGNPYKDEPYSVFKIEVNYSGKVYMRYSEESGTASVFNTERITRDKIPANVIEEITAAASRVSSKLMREFGMATSTIKNFKGVDFTAKYIGDYVEKGVVYRVYEPENAYIQLGNKGEENYIRLEPKNGGRTIFIDDPQRLWRKQRIWERNRPKD